MKVRSLWKRTTGYDCPSRRESALDLSRKEFTTSTCSVSSFQRASLRKTEKKLRLKNKGIVHRRHIFRPGSRGRNPTAPYSIGLGQVLVYILHPVPRDCFWPDCTKTGLKPSVPPLSLVWVQYHALPLPSGLIFTWRCYKSHLGVLKFKLCGFAPDES